MKIAILAIIFFFFGVIALFVSFFIEDPTVHAIVTHLASICIAVGLVEIVIQFVAVKDLIKSVSNQLNYILKLPIAAFFENRGTLPSWGDELSGAKEVWIVWHTASVQGLNCLLHLTEQRIKTRLILTDPTSKAMDEVAKTGTRSRGAMEGDIKELTKKAGESGVEVKWFDGPIGNSTIIKNPDIEKPWARVEIIIPFLEPTYRPSIRVSHEKGNKALENIIKGYKELWDKSKSPASVLSNSNVNLK